MRAFKDGSENTSLASGGGDQNRGCQLRACLYVSDKENEELTYTLAWTDPRVLWPDGACTSVHTMEGVGGCVYIQQP